MAADFAPELRAAPLRLIKPVIMSAAHSLFVDSKERVLKCLSSSSHAEASNAIDFYDNLCTAPPPGKDNIPFCLSVNTFCQVLKKRDDQIRKWCNLISDVLESPDNSNATPYKLVVTKDLGSFKHSLKQYLEPRQTKYFLFEIERQLPLPELGSFHLSFGFIRYPPLVEKHPTSMSSDLYYRLFDIVRPDLSAICTSVIESDSLSLSEALHRLWLDYRSPEHLDCIFGIFETPARIRRYVTDARALAHARGAAIPATFDPSLSPFVAILHTVGLVVALPNNPKPQTLQGLSKIDSRAFEQLLANKDLHIHCVDLEVGGEYVDELLQLKQNRVTRHSSQLDPASVLSMLREEARRAPAIAIVDALTAQDYLFRNAGAIRILNINMPSYGHGVWLRRDLPHRQNIANAMSGAIWKARMSEEFLEHERRVLKDYSTHVSSIHRPLI